MNSLFSQRATPVLWLVIPLLGLSISSYAQTATGSILGTVSDSTGAAVAGATVTIKAVTTGSTRTVTTSESGTYSAVALVPGEFDIKVQR